MSSAVFKKVESMCVREREKKREKQKAHDLHLWLKCVVYAFDWACHPAAFVENSRLNAKSYIVLNTA